MVRLDYESLEFENAYIYRRCSVPLENQGLVLIRGLNMDDAGYLGAGKSSIFEVFSQIQIGKGGKPDRRKGDHRSEIVNSFVGGDLAARLKLRVDGHPYEIRQYRSHYRHGNKVFIIDRQTGKNILPRSATRAPHKYVREELLRLDETTFFNLIYLVQELNNVMIHGSEYDRRKRLTVMFDLHVYDELRAAANRSLGLQETAMADIESVRSELFEVEERLDDAPDLDELEQDLEETQQQLQQYQEEHSSDTKKYTTLSDRVAKLQRREECRTQIVKRFHAKPYALSKKFPKPTDITAVDVTAWKKKRDNLNAELASVTNDLSKLRKRSVLEGQLRKLSGRDLEEIQQELAEVKAQLTYLTKVELPQSEERAELLGKLTNLQEPDADVSVLEEEQQDTTSRERSLTSSIESLSLQLQGAVCPTCHRPFAMTAEEITAKQVELKDLRSELEEVTAYSNELKKRIRGARIFSQVRLRMKAIETERSPDEVMSDVRENTKLERQLTAEHETSQRRLQIEAELAAMPSESKVELEDKSKKIERQLTKAATWFDDAKYIRERLAEMEKLPRGKVREAEKDARELRIRMRRASKLISETSSEVAHLESSVDEIRRLRRRATTLRRTILKRDSVIKEIQCLKALHKAFGSGGLKHDRFQSILTDAAERTVPSYANILWPSRNVELQLDDQDGSLQLQMVRTDTNTITNSSLLSGGERHKSGLAFLFGMRDLKEMYTGSSANILVVDEPFGNMDPLGTEGLLSIFSMLRQKFCSVFVISHRPEVLSHPIWDQTWWAVRENNDAQLYFNELPARYQQIANELVKQ